ncbi:glycosyl hydrolase family 65 protein [Thiocapsa sp.]|uniref:glycosyl hydrolase family 65 protein n=1 Tax=Thiocapsa sp. TaxID=2024551 RepID=UPI0035942C82
MYRLILESLLGLRLEVDTLHVAPCLPADWDGFKLSYRCRETLYRIAVTHSGDAEGGTRITLDGVAQDGPGIPVVDDGREHAVEVMLSGRPIEQPLS